VTSASERNKDSAIEPVTAIGVVDVSQLGILDAHPLTVDFFESLQSSALTSRHVGLPPDTRYSVSNTGFVEIRWHDGPPARCCDLSMGTALRREGRDACAC
jgi:hypothetical protein